MKLQRAAQRSRAAMAKEEREMAEREERIRRHTELKADQVSAPSPGRGSLLIAALFCHSSVVFGGAASREEARKSGGLCVSTANRIRKAA
eukprot:4156239-Pyramimonas_sp.AAC.2